MTKTEQIRLLEDAKKSLLHMRDTDREVIGRLYNIIQDLKMELEAANQKLIAYNSLYGEIEELK